MKTMHKKILVVDDERAIADLVCDILNAEGMEAIASYEPISALKSLSEKHFDLVISDIMMPGMDGFEFCLTLRRISDVPIIFLTAKDHESDVVSGLTIGADDYIVKPFKPKELLARVKALLRRADGSRDRSSANDEVIRSSKGIEVNLKTHKATLHDIELQLTPKEFGILGALIRKLGQPVPSSEIYESVWDEQPDHCSANTVMVHIRHIRRKLAEIDSSTNFIDTAWGVGYKISE